MGTPVGSVKWRSHMSRPPLGVQPDVRHPGAGELRNVFPGAELVSSRAGRDEPEVVKDGTIRFSALGEQGGAAGGSNSRRRSTLFDWLRLVWRQPQNRFRGLCAGTAHPL